MCHLHPRMHWRVGGVGSYFKTWENAFYTQIFLSFENIFLWGGGAPHGAGHDATDYGAVSENVNIMFFSAHLC